MIRPKLATVSIRMILRLLSRIRSTISPDRRPDWEKQREREFIEAVNSLKTLRVTPGGRMSIESPLVS